MRRIKAIIGPLCCWLSLFAGTMAQAQTVTVRNFLNPEAPAARESFIVVEGEGFTDIELAEPFSAPLTLGGVTVKLDGAPQRLRAVSPARIVFIADVAGAASRAVEITTKSGAVRNGQIEIVNAWPGVFVQGTGEENDSFIPSGLWTQDGINLLPLTGSALPVGPTERPTLIVVQGSGWRFANRIAVRLNGVPCQVVAARPSSLFPGQDELVFQLPSILAGAGGVDLIISVAGREANFARLNLGPVAR